MNRDRLQSLLLKVIQTEVESKLNQSLHQRVYIAQPETTPNQIGSPGEVKLKISKNSQETLPNFTKIETIFDRPEIQGKLLISGVPGSGKTTLLFQLAKVLCDRAINDPALPIPILLDIPSWAIKKQAIAKWILTILQQKYSLDAATAKQFIKDHQVILLFDGLDEIEESQPNKFIQKLNKFIQNYWSVSLVICGGQVHEQKAQDILHIDACIELQPLTQEQVSTYLVKTDSEFLWNQIENDPNLVKLAQIPLFLNLMVIAATEINVPQWQQMPTSEEKQSYLWNAYIQNGLKRGDRKGSQDDRLQTIPEVEQTLRSLSWLAQKSIKQKHNFDRLDYSCLDNPLEKIASVLIFASIAGFMSGVIFWLMFDRTFGFMFGATLGLMIGMIAAIFIDDLIPPKPSFSLSKQTLILAGVGSLLSAVICGVISGSIFWPILGQDSGIIYGSLFAGNGALIFSLLTLFTGGFSPPEFRIIYQLQQGDRSQRESIKNIIPYLVISVIMGTFWLWVVWILQGKNFQVWQLLIGGIVIGGLLAIAFGGVAAIHQFSIRLTLWLTRRIPRNYREFLNDAKSCLLIQRISGLKGGDRFIHPLLRQHLEKYYFRSDIIKNTR